MRSCLKKGVRVEVRSARRRNLESLLQSMFHIWDPHTQVVLTFMLKLYGAHVTQCSHGSRDMAQWLKHLLYSGRELGSAPSTHKGVFYKETDSFWVYIRAKEMYAYKSLPVMYVDHVHSGSRDRQFWNWSYIQTAMSCHVGVENWIWVFWKNRCS